MTDEWSGDLMARWRNGDQQAAAELFHRYAGRLIALARSRLSAPVARRVDAEDVVQSAYRSFFNGARAGQYDLQRGGDLWQLLVRITLHKLQHQVRKNRAQKRAVGREEPLQAAEGPALRVLADGPSPVEAVALVDEVEQLMRRLDPVERRILEMRLQNYDLREIAAATRCSYRTVCRVLERVRRQLEQAPGDLSR